MFECAGCGYPYHSREAARYCMVLRGHRVRGRRGGVNPLAGCEHTRDQLLDLVWTLVLDIAARTGHDPEVVALTHGIVPAHNPTRGAPMA